MTLTRPDFHAVCQRPRTSADADELTLLVSTKLRVVIALHFVGVPSQKDGRRPWKI